MNSSSREYYLQFCSNTDPGQYSDMYKTLPVSLDALCDLVQKQLVHPWDGSEQPVGRRYEPRANYRVEEMLANLRQLNCSGITMERTLNERVIAGCRENTLLLTSILRYQGVPARPRAGWCKYISSNVEKYTDHWLTEMWNEAEQRWLLVDAKPKKIDVSRSEFRFGGEAWLELRRGQAKPELYRQQEDWFYLKLNFGHDFNTVLGSGPHYWEAPPLFHKETTKMTIEELKLLDEIAELLQEPDENLAALQGLQEQYQGLQGLKSAWVSFEKTVYS